MDAVVCTDKLGNNAHAVSGPTNAAFEHVGGAELCANGAQVISLSRERKGGGTPNHSWRWNTCQQIEYILDEAIGAARLILLLAHSRARHGSERRFRDL